MKTKKQKFNNKIGLNGRESLKRNFKLKIWKNKLLKK